MPKLNRRTRRKIFKSLTLLSGLMLIINMTTAGVFFIPASANANEVPIGTCLEQGGSNDGGECPGGPPDWDKSSLSFDESYACLSYCYEIKVKICNTGDEDMEDPSSYEVWYSESGNPKDGVGVASGEIPALEKDECQFLTYVPTQDGNYMFRALQRPGHPGQGELWSETCGNIKMMECQLPACGDGNLNWGEECDAGQNNGQVCVPPYNGSCDYCSNECEIIRLTDGYCGDGVINGQEQCDGEAGVGEHQICSPDCALLDLTYCGDGTKQTPNDEGAGGPGNDGYEDCDGNDGVGQNQICSPECVIINLGYCGDGTVNGQEQCDDGLDNGQSCAPPYGGACDYCSNICEIIELTGPYCGDGIQNGPEDCDGQSGVPEHYTCTASCALEYIPYCGDGITNQQTEECDDGNQNDNDECRNDCTLPTVCENDLDVMIVFDRSGSMGYNTPTKISQAKTAANTFLDKLRAGDQSGLVSYSTTATLNKQLSNNHNSTKTFISALTASGATNIGDGIMLANGELGSIRANPQAVKIEILLTDGKANKPYGNGSGEWPADVAYAKAKADQAASQGIIIFTIGLGSDVSASMLQYIASTTGGQYFFAPSGGDLENIFDQIAFRACEYGSISGCKYNDTNNDGDITGEPTMAGWKINLTNGQTNLSQLTAQDGCYTFAGLSAGNYTVAEDPIQSYDFIQTYPTNPNNYSITLAEGQNAIDKDFGNYIVECGNGYLDEGEECDDGLGNGYVCQPPYGGSCAYCSNACEIIELQDGVCGDGQIDQGHEECDDGAQNGQACTPAYGKSCNYCSQTCETVELPGPYCGDGAKNGPEECDGTDGVPENYICTDQCVLEYVPYCGDGEVNQQSEECDANGQNGQSCVPPYGGACDYCSDICTVIRLTGPYCGDGVKNGSEECDGSDGTPAHYACTQSCILEYIPYCGDGAINQTSEQCDDGNNIGGDGCSPACQTEIICGDGTVNGQEQCDDGLDNGQSCVPPYGGACDYCSNTCEIIELTGPYCGDGIQNGLEDCDGQSGVPEHYTCTASCVLEYIPYCGDGITNQQTEECDDGNQNDNDECRNDCALPTVCENDLDVMIVFDRSGSMGYNTPTKISQAKTAANTFLDKLRAGDQSGLVSYSTTATLNKPLSNDHNGTKTFINALTASGATNIGDAINLANGELGSVRANPQAAKIEILLTDGKANKPNGPGFGEWPADVAYAKAKADQAASQGIIIFTIGLGSDVSASMLQYIASTTGGQYFFAPSGGDLENIFDQIAFRACEYGSISGCKYNDTNNDGDITGEPTMAGWKINLTNGQTNLSQLTAQDGCYTFAGLSEGHYTVSEDSTQPSTFIQTYPANPSTYSIDLTEGQNAADKDFGNYIVECGNGYLDQGEECDDGLGNGYVCQPPYGGSCAYCSNICQIIELTGPYCGDDVKNGDEQCDGTDGVGENQTCTLNCTLESTTYCGDGIKNGQEQCDGTDGVGQHQSCNQDCTLNNLTYCGDGIKQVPNDEWTGGPNNDGYEDCDGQSGTPEHYICTQSCTLEYVPYCGDGEVNQQSEECDANGQNGQVCTPSYGGSCDYCSNICQNVHLTGPYCGDGVKNGSEQCDDSNNNNGDGCSSACYLELDVDPGDIIVNEIMNDPDAVSDSYGEWFEVYNTTGHGIELKDCNIHDNGTDSHNISSSLIVPSHGYAVLARNGNPSQNGGFTADYVYGGSFVLGNLDDEVILTCGATEIDRVEYDGGPNFPHPTAKSMILKNPFIDNNVGANWCVSRSAFGLGDLGTPGSLNDVCNPGSISGYKYGDADGSLSTTDDWTALAGWVVSLFDATSTTTPIATTTTDSLGYYIFNNLAAGLYSLAENLLGGWIQLIAPLSIDLLEGAVSENNNFVNYQEYCGDGIKNGEEECDGQSGVGEHQSCSSYCILLNQPYCGDGIKNGSEECDGQSGVGANQTCTGSCTVQTTFTASGGGGVVWPIPGPSKPIVLGEEGKPALTIDKSVNLQFANPGDEAEYTVKIINNGNLTAYDVKLSDILPAGFTLVDGGGTTKDLTIGNIGPGENKVVTYKVKVAQNVSAGIYANLAKATASNHDPVSDISNLEVRKVEVLGEELVPTGFSIKELLLVMTSIFMMFGLAIGLKRKYKLN